jgi:ABC-type lipoprotein export system ATPase subunit
MTNILSGKKLSKEYRTVVDKVLVFENINLEIEAGSATAIIGQSGRGKTTLLNILSGLDRPTSGEVFLNQERIDNKSEKDLSDFRNRNIGFVFQHHYLLEDFTALDNVLIPLRIGGKKIDPETADWALELLSNLGIYERREHYPDQLSGGERQRVAIARALVFNPLVVFADEPTGSLDKKNSAMVEEMLWELKDKWNKTLVIATHNMEIAKKCSIIDLG